MIRFTLLILSLLIMCIGAIVLYKKYNHPACSQHSLPTPPIQRLWLAIVSAEVVILYFLLADCLSTAWLKGDDYIFFQCHDKSLLDRLLIISSRYTTWNGRLGDIIASLLGLAENRWQQVFLTPLFIVATPFAVHRLIAPAGKSIFSSSGAIFILFFVSLYTVSVSLSPWRNFWCYAAAVNYIWPIPIICLFLSRFRAENQLMGNTFQFLAISFLLGLYSAWSLECVTIFLLPGLLIWAYLQYRNKKHITPCNMSGILGVFWGALFMFGTPALSRRAKAELSKRLFDPSELNWEEMLDFVINQTPENLHLLQGGTVRYLLDGIPLPLHACYLPEMLHHFLPCCIIALSTFILLFLVAILTISKNKKQVLLKASFGIMLAFTCVSAYLYSCIPTDMSYLPPSLIIVISCCYLFVRIKRRTGKILQYLITISLCAYSLSAIVPSIAEAKQYKKYETIRLNMLHEQINRGKKDIVLTQPYNTPPVDKLGLITSMDLSENPASYPNFIAAMCYHVESITLKRNTESLPADKNSTRD